MLTQRRSYKDAFIKTPIQKGRTRATDIETQSQQKYVNSETLTQQRRMKDADADIETHLYRC